MGAPVNMDTNLLSRENSKILRGLGIMAIILHNFSICPQFGLSVCNEMSFSIGKSMAYFSTFGNGNMIAEFLSFLGWTGVPVFVFLTGYGIALTPHRLTYCKSICYIKKNWIKLFVLLLPMLLVFSVVDIMHHQYENLPRRAFYLTFLANFAYPWVKCNPGSYWYFGLTFQLYLLWAMFGKYFDKRNLLAWSLLFLAGLWILCLADAPELLAVYRHSFTGWFCVFALGVYIAQHKNGLSTPFQTKWWQELILAVILLAMMILMNYSLTSWIFVPLVAFALFFVIGKLVMRSRYMTAVFRWIGGISASLFVCHAFVKGIAIQLFSRIDNSLLVVLYLVLTFALSLMYDKYYRSMISFVNSRMSPRDIETSRNKPM